jgi:hypothetical protein
MRVSKANSNGVTSYRYDGQMGMEDIDFAGNGTTVPKKTDYGIGARGVDAMYVTQNGTTTANYPIYDALGNMISTPLRHPMGPGTSTSSETEEGAEDVRLRNRRTRRRREVGDANRLGDGDYPIYDAEGKTSLRIQSNPSGSGIVSKIARNEKVLAKMRHV